LGVVGMNALAFILVPIYTRRVSPHEYGVLEILNRCQDVLAVIITSGLATAALAFYQFEAQEKERQQRVFSTALYGIVLNSTLLSLLALPFVPSLSRSLFPGGEYTWAMRAYLLIIPLEVLFQAALVSLQAEFRSTLYVIASLARLALGIGLSLVLVWWLRMGLAGVIMVTLLTIGLPAVVCTFYILHCAAWRFDLSIWKQMVAYGLPFVPGSFFLFILNSGDRYFLNAFQGPDVVGIYSVSYKISAIATFAVLLPFVKLWGSLSISLALRPEGPKQIARATMYLSTAYCYVGVLLALATPLLLRFLVSSSYWDAYRPTPWIILAYLFWSISVVADTVFYAKKKTRVKPLILLATCVLCIALYALLIPRYGMMGAAWATVAAYCTLAAITIRVGNRYLVVPYEYGRFAKLLTVTVAVFLLGRAATSIALASDYLMVICAALAFPLLLIGLRFWTRAELEMFSQLQTSARTRIRSFFAPRAGEV
jgi:O-antigen/teichoic acid export membrane protein